MSWTSPLVKSCIFHFVFETIHPFSDGNGRTGRLWQTVILGRWNRIFYALPIENMVLCHQRRYYQALHSAQMFGDARVFVDFMLDMILRTLKTKGAPEGGKKKVVRKGGKKTADRIVEMIRRNPKVTLLPPLSRFGPVRQETKSRVIAALQTLFDRYKGISDMEDARIAHWR